MLLGNPEVPREGVEDRMAQEHLDRPDIDARRAGGSQNSGAAYGYLGRA